MKARITKIEEKGADNFNGMVLIKFASPEKREVAMKQFNDSKNVFGEGRNFMNKDSPVQHRANFSFLLNFKKLLVECQFEIISFDDDSGTISVAGLAVLRVAIDDFTFKLTWLADDWGRWNELTEDSKFIELIKTAVSKLQKASQSKGKGKRGSA